MPPLPESQRTPAAEPTFTGPAIFRSVTTPPAFSTTISPPPEIAVTGPPAVPIWTPPPPVCACTVAAGIARDDIAAVGLEHGFAADPVTVILPAPVVQRSAPPTCPPEYRRRR